jgi:uncharacterized membrane protein
MEYLSLKLIHVVAVMVFLGNIVTGLYWMRFAVGTKDIGIVNHAIKGIIKADRYFTIPGVIVITTFGILAAIQGQFPLLRTGWIFWSIVMFSISGLIFGIKVAPLQKEMLSMTLDQKSSTDFDWTGFHKVHLAWDVWGGLAILTPLAALVMMILKVPQ